MEYLLYGILAGLAAGISFGPAFFSITETSIRQGFIKGVFVSVGISISDITFCVIFIIGLDRFLDNTLFQTAGTIIGGAVLAGFGIHHLLRSKVAFVKVTTVKNWFQNLLKGFIVNTFNPYVPIFWAGVVTTAGLNIPNEATYVFFAGMLATTLSVDILKSKIASSFRKKRSQKFAQWMQIVVGLLFLATGLYLLVSTLFSI